MGYDLYIRGGEQSQDDGYYRFNIWGMGRWRELAIKLDLLDFETENPFAGDWDREVEAHRREGRMETDEDGDERLPREVVRALLGRESEGGRVPAFKFGSNDGWIVTPAECMMLDEALRSDEAKALVVELWGAEAGRQAEGSGQSTEQVLGGADRYMRADFAAFCARAAKAEGFEVY